MYLWQDKFSRTIYMIWMKRNNFTVRESNGIKSKFLLNFLGKLLVIMQTIIPMLDSWHILLKYSIKKKSFNKPNLICLGVVEHAKSMEGTKRAQWVLPGNCLWGGNFKHAVWLCYVNWYIHHMEYQMSTWDIKRRHGWEKIDMRSDVIDNCPCIKHFKNKEIVSFVHYDATMTHGWVQKWLNSVPWVSSHWSVESFVEQRKLRGRGRSHERFECSPLSSWTVFKVNHQLQVQHPKYHER